MKLRLNRETLTDLTPGDLVQIGGAANEATPACPTYPLLTGCLPTSYCTGTSTTI